MNKLFTLFALLCFTTKGFSQTFWTNLNSPTSASYYAISHDGTKMYGCNGNIGTGGQFYYKQGAGAWNTVTVTINTLTSINNILCLANGNLVVTGQQSFTVPVVYSSTDNGTTWTQSTATVTGYNQNIIQDAAGNVYIYNYVLGSTIKKSTDNGASFATASGTFAVKNIAVTGNTLFACGTNGGWNIWKSTDGAATWSLMPNNASQGNQSNIYATPNGNVYFSDYKSTDGGNTWVQMTAPPSGSGVYMVDTQNNIYIKDEPTNLFKSNDAGATYTNVVNGLNWSPLISAQRKIATNDGKLYFSTIGAPNYSIYVHQTGTISSVSNQTLPTENLNVYPNPASNNLVITLSNVYDEITNVSIIDMLGKVTPLNFNGEKNEINISDLNEGIYFLNIKTANSTLNKKIIINR